MNLKKSERMKKNGILAILILSIVTSMYAQDKYITTSDSTKLYISIKGNGVPCLFIHGGPGQGSNYWEQLAGDFCEKHFQMIYLDQRGCGRSTSPRNADYSMDRMVKDFEEVRKTLNIDEWFIMGHSFGSVLQMGYVHRHPQKIKGMLMFNCTLNLKKSLEESYIPSVMKFFKINNTLTYTDLSIPLTTRLDSIETLFTKREDVWKLSFPSLEATQKFVNTYNGFENWNMDFRNTAFSMQEYLNDFCYMTAEIKTPVLFLHTRNDNNTGANHHLDIKFPNQLLYVIEGGHMEFIEKSDEYLKAIEDFKIQFNFVTR